jgi:hypothetical protein
MGTSPRSTLRGLGVTAALAAVALVLAPAASADVPATLGSFDDTAHWSGQMSTGVTLDPALCLPSTCVSRTLNLDLPPGTFDHPGGLMVSLQWPDDELDLGYDLNLYVYGPDGKLAGSSTDLQYSTDEAVWIQNPVNGAYRVLITSAAELGTTPYELAAHFDRGREYKEATTLLGLTPWDQQMVALGDRPASPATPLLPDLVPVPAHNFHLGDTTVAANFYTAFDRGLEHPPSCNLQETLGLDDDTPGTDTPHPIRCLRFDSDLLNLGAGPFEIRAYPNNGNGTDAWQAIYNSDGTYSERKAGQAVFSSAHGHVHFEGFEDTALYEMNSDGTPGAVVSRMVDKGRCALDTHNHLFGQRGDQPMHYLFPSTCDQADNQDPNDPVYPNALYFRSGVSAGWDDEYPWFIPDQYIDVTNVPDGRYLIVTKINGGNNVLESDHSNNMAEACVELTQTGAGPCEIPQGGGAPTARAASGQSPKAKKKCGKRARKRHRCKRRR